jgi:hypothetical protein
MLASTPALAPSPLDIGGLFSASINALKRRFWLLVLLALLPSILTLVVVGIGMVLVVGSAAAMAGLNSSAPSPLMIVGIVVALTGGILGALMQVKAYGLMSLAAYEIAQGGQPTLGGVLQRSRGFLPRMAPVIAIAVGAIIVGYAGFFGILAGTINAASRTGGRESSAAVLGAVGVLFLLAIAAVPIAIFFGTKLLYTVPAVALEDLGGIAGMKRSWAITRGSFWRTFGYYLVGSLCVAVVSYIVSIASQVLMVPFTSRLSGLGNDTDPSAVLAALAGLAPAMAIVVVLQLIVSMISVPFLQTYVTYMFIDQVRRSEMPQAPAYGYPSAAGPYAQPGQYYGQPYPAQPYPGQVYPGQTPLQAPGWTGQATPPPGPTPQYPPSQGWGAPQAPGGQYPSQPWTRPQNPDDAAGDHPS